MKIQIASPLKHDFIRETVEGIEEPKLAFVEEKGINLLFEGDTDAATAIAAVKKAIKATEIGAVLYFSVTEVK
jgi:hypothetical protein